MAEALNGVWKVKDSENFDNYLKAIGRQMTDIARALKLKGPNQTVLK